MCGDSISIPNPSPPVTRSITSNHVQIEQVSPDQIKKEQKRVESHIANHEEQQSRINIMYKQRHAYQMLHENDEIETRKRLKNNQLMINRIEVMYKTSEELFVYLRKMIDLETKHEENIHKSVLNTFGTSENGGSVHSAGIAIDALLKNRYEQFNDINDRVFKKILLSSQKYQAKLKQQQSYFQNRITKFNTKVNDAKIKLNQEWNKYENTLNRTLKQKQLEQEGKSKGGEAIENDPFLAGKGYVLAQKQYKAALVKFVLIYPLSTILTCQNVYFYTEWI